MSRLILVRHGFTKSNSAERYWGQTDVELSADGLKQAERLRDRLATEKIDAIYSSNLKRAVVTAQTIASVHKLEVVVCPEIGEMNFGKLEGLTFVEISKLYSEVTRMWKERNPALKCPGGESAREFNLRVAQFDERLKKHTPEETILIVAHSGSLRALMCHFMKIGMERRWQFRLDFASITSLETFPEGAILTGLNENCHPGGL